MDAKKPTYEELQRRIRELEKEALDRIQVEDALRKSEERYRTLMESIRDGVYILDKEGHFTFVNDVIIERSGSSRRWFLGKRSIDIVRPEDRERVKNYFNAAMRGERVPVYELAYTNAHGQEIWVEVNTNPLLQGGKISGLFAVSREITERKLADEKLRQSEKRYRELIEGSRDGYAMVNMKGEIVASNSIFREMLGYTEDEMKNKIYNKITPVKWHSIEDKILKQQVIKRGYSDIYEKEYQRKDGTTFPIEKRTYLVKDERGKGIGMWAFVRDVTERKKADEALRKAHEKLEQRVKERTAALSKANEQLHREIEERKQAEEALKKSQEHLRSLMESATNFAVYRLVRDEENPHHFSVVFVSPSIVDILGVSDPMRFKTWFDNLYTDDVERVEKAILRSLKTFKLNETMRIYHPKKKDWRWIEAISTGVADREYHLKYMNGILIDITKRKRTEQALKEREKELEIKTDNLEEMNTALRVLLQKREEDKNELEEKVLFNIKEMVEPYIEKIKLCGLVERQKACIEILESNIKDIISPFSQKLYSKYLSLTPSEIQVANLVKQGKSTKEIADMCNLSKRTIESHRDHIRRKLGIKNTKVNLRTHLLSIR